MHMIMVLLWSYYGISLRIIMVLLWSYYGPMILSFFHDFRVFTIILSSYDDMIVQMIVPIIIIMIMPNITHNITCVSSALP